MNDFYSPEHSQRRRRSPYNVTQTIFTSKERRQIAWSVLGVIKQATSIKHGGQ